MRRITVIDPSIAGISGDMLLASFIDAGANVHAIQEVLHLIPEHYSRCKSIALKTENVLTHGFRACGIDLGISEEFQEEQETSADQFVAATMRIIQDSNLSQQASDFTLNSVRMLVDVESRLHGTDVGETHLHEAGSADTLADVLGVAAAVDSLDLFGGDIVSTPVAVGGGHVKFSHGTLSIPAPAVMEIVRRNQIPILGGPEAVELATPTGVTMLANLAKEFSAVYPTMVAERVGYGSGKITLNSSPNFLRVVIGTRLEGDSIAKETVQMLETNLDDLSGEVLSHATQRLIEAGARDAWITSGLFKKNRPGHVLHVLCDPQDTEKLSRLMIEETGTLGVRQQSWQRLTLSRDAESIKVEISGRTFEVRIKVARDENGSIVRVKPEFDDIRMIAKEVGLSARRVEKSVTFQISRKYEGE
ncbi:MAG TPA: nickel pincer cofactor biosynthesis protein LarC [Methylomirabilota bacterium]|nr:nickel pincer cofactor biosynthesis protein LarC [Methylomirabilota bacterium]